MALTFRTTDPEKWGTGKETGLSNVEIDTNFWDLNTQKLDVTGGTISGDLSITGTVSATDVNSISDIKLKTDLERITHALDKVKQLTGYTYTLISTQQRAAGLVAQDVLKVQPEFVDTSTDTLKLSYGNMMGLIVEAIKELDSKIEDIRNSISNK